MIHQLRLDSDNLMTSCEMNQKFMSVSDQARKLLLRMVTNIKKKKINTALSMAQL